MELFSSTAFALIRANGAPIPPYRRHRAKRSARARPWFADEQVAPLFMPVGFGLLAIALAVGLCAILGLFRDLALLTLRIVAFAGLLVLGAGGFGMSQSQPPEVYLPLLGAGGITLVFALMLYGPTLRRFRTVELERLPRLPRAH